MNSVTGWIIGILSVVLLGVVVDLILGESKIGKYIKSVFAAVTVLVIILPIPSLVENGINFDSDFIIQNDFTLDESYLQYAERVKLRALAKGIEEQLASDGVQKTSVTVEGKTTASDIEIERVRVNLENAVIDVNKQHINKYEMIRELVAEYLKIEKGRVIVYGD